MTAHYLVARPCRHPLRQMGSAEPAEIDALFQIAYHLTRSRRSARRFLAQTYSGLRLPIGTKYGPNSRPWRFRLLMRKIRLDFPMLYPRRIYRPVNEVSQGALGVIQLLSDDEQAAVWFERECDDLMRLAFEHLEIEDRALILLVDAQKFTYSETAYILEISEEMVAAALRIARTRLIKQFHNELIRYQQQINARHI